MCQKPRRWMEPHAYMNDSSLAFRIDADSKSMVLRPQKTALEARSSLLFETYVRLLRSSKDVGKFGTSRAPGHTEHVLLQCCGRFNSLTISIAKRIRITAVFPVDYFAEIEIEEPYKSWRAVV